MTYKESIQQFRKEHSYKKMLVNNVEFSYLFCGEGEKVLTFLVGGMGISEMWFPYVEALEKEYKILTFDYPMEYMDNESLAEGICGLLDGLRIHQTVLIGSSFGGYMAQIFARKYPAKTEGLCLFSTAALTKNTLEGLSKRGKYAGFLLWIIKYVPYEFLKPIFRRACMRHIVNAAPEEYQFMKDLFWAVFEDYTSEMDYHMTSLLADVLNQKPCTKEEYTYLAGRTLLILPKEDDSFTPVMQRELTELMTDPVVVENMDAGHLATILRIERYVEEIKKFLELPHMNGGRSKNN